MEGLPKLPGYSFPDLSRTKYGVPNHLDFVQGFPTVKSLGVGIGGEPLDTQSMLYLRPTDSVRFDPSLVYGRSKCYLPAEFKPHFVIYDKKCLTFKGFFKQSVYDSPLESYRVRRINVIYFLEDDTITVVEPPTPNAGFPQGRLVSRSKIPKGDTGNYWHWKDLNVGCNLPIYGIVYHLCSCDMYTREYLASQGVEVREDEELPLDPYTDRRSLLVLPNAPSKKTTLHNDKLYRFLEFDKKILRFRSIWDDPLNEGNDMKPYMIHYFLMDDTIEVAAPMKLDGQESTILMKRTKVPKKWTSISPNFPGAFLELTDEDIEEFFAPKDLIVGTTVMLYGRKFLLLDCDKFTRDYYAECFGIEQPAAMEPPKSEREKPPIVQKFPAYTGFGTVEDSIQSWYHFNPDPPKIDLIRYLNMMSKKLRYTAVMDYVHPEDKERQFVIEYRLKDGTISVTEVPTRNSGFTGGRFLKATLVPKPGTSRDNPEYYSPLDFRLGAVVVLFGHRFIVTGMDLAVYRYMEANPEKFPQDQVAEIRKYLIREGYLNDDIKDMAEYRKKEEVEEPVEVDIQLMEPIKAKEIETGSSGVGGQSGNARSATLACAN